MFCQSCGTQIQGSAFCSNCGAAVARPAAASTQFPTAHQSHPNSGNNNLETKPNSFSTLGIVFGSVAVFFFPILFGVAGIVLAAIAKSKAEPRSDLALGVSIGGTFLGFIFGALTAGF